MATITTEKPISEQATIEKPISERQVTERRAAPQAIPVYISPAPRDPVQSAGFWGKTASKIGQWAEEYADYKLQSGYWNLFRI